MKKIFVSTAVSLLFISGVYAERDNNIDTTTGTSIPQNKIEIPYRLFPSNKSPNTPPDTHLTIEFDSPVQLNNKGVIRIY